MIENNRIIIIDDDEEHLAQLRQVFYNHGIGCKGFVYDGFNFPDHPMTGVRFAFFDVHLNQAGDINSTLKDAIGHYININNGPYVLVFWTNRVELISTFINFINRTDDEFRRKLKPLLITSIDKTDFLDSEKKLTEKLEEILSSDLVKCLIRFDESVLIAARQTLDRILNIIPFSDNWGESNQYNKDCQDVFSKIAEATYGLNQAKSNPDSAIKESIVPVFKHILLNNGDTYWADFLLPLKQAKKSGDLKFPEGFSVEKLNTIIHIDGLNIPPQNIYSRGAVCKFIEQDFDNNFTRLFNIKYTEWFGLTFPGITKEERQTAIPIAIEFSAACDYCQNKKRTNKYILGIMCPSQLLKNVKIDQKGDYSLYLPFSFEYNDKNWSIGLNLNYTFVITPARVLLSEPPLFLLSKELMDMIGHKYASHISRIGYTSF